MPKYPLSLIAIGKKIRALREDSGFTQESFADHAGLDRAYYGAIERGERNLAALNLIKIASALEVQVGELFPSLAFRPKKQ
jgi:transcriptional regulator with XRE-family HTH domain